MPQVIKKSHPAGTLLPVEAPDFDLGLLVRIELQLLRYHLRRQVGKANLAAMVR